MSKQPERGVIGSLPRTRPHRRSDKRPAPRVPAAAAAAVPPEVTAEVPAEVPPEVPAAVPARARKPRTAGDPSGLDAPGPLETAVQAAAELAEIGLHASARALRRAVSRLPHP